MIRKCLELVICVMPRLLLPRHSTRLRRLLEHRWLSGSRLTNGVMHQPTTGTGPVGLEAYTRQGEALDQLVHVAMHTARMGIGPEFVHVVVQGKDRH